MINGELYMVYLDGNFVGVAEDEYEASDVAENASHGSRPLYDDEMPDRIWYEKVNVNRWIQCEKAPKCIEDKYTGKSILCADTTEVEKALIMLNQADLEREKAEAKVRALLL